MTETQRTVTGRVDNREEDNSAGGSPTQLRLALVCFGGVSLAIYMHGVTKELHRLVSASRAFDDGAPDAANPFDPSNDSRFAYFEALRELAQAGHPISVEIDIITGTSAGGINGVCLAEAIARNGSQDALKDLWIEQGDLKTLLRYGRFGPWKVRAAIAATWTLLHAKDPASPLSGARMSRLLVGAIAQMNTPVASSTARQRTTLLPDDGQLSLFVTTTDLDGFPVLVATGIGGASQRETDHAQYLRFTTDHSQAPTADSDFGPDAVLGLAFAARATSSFPGAFPPVSATSFLTEAKQKGKSSVITRFLQKRYSLGDRTSDDAWFVDGGVLDNAPFDLAIDAIANRAAQSQVKRHLIYIDPDPPAHLALTPSDAPKPQDAPGYLGALMHGALSVKGSHSVLPDLIRIRELNLRIAEIGAIADLQIVPVNEAVQKAWLEAVTPGQTRSSPGSWSMDDLDDVKDLSTKLHDSVPQFIGAAYPTYCRLKVDVAGRRLADELAKRLVFPPDSAKSSFLRAVISAWARGRPEWEDSDPAELMALLGPIDVPYRERRLRFLLAGINDLYGSPSDNPPPRPSLDALKQEGWQLLKATQTAIPRAIAQISPAAVEFLEHLDDESIYDAPEQFAKANDQQFVNIFKECSAALKGDAAAHREPLLPSNGPMWTAFQRHAQGWDQKDSRNLLSRYLAFPLWDGLIFPIVSLGELPQFTPIPVTQYSPVAACAIPAPNGKLKGISLHHFGGFTDAGWRANDYLWGRLDGVELILRTLRSTTGRAAPPIRPLPQEDAVAAAGAHLAGGVAAVLAAEAKLNHLDPELLRQLTDAVGALKR